MKIIPAFVVLGAVWLGGCRSDLTSGRFEKADVNNDGLVTRIEAGSYVASELFEGLDVNRNGKINFAEWNAAGNPQRTHNFAAADRNRDGGLTEEELRVAAVNSRQMAEFVAQADSDRNGGINKREALRYYASKEGPVR